MYSIVIPLYQGSAPDGLVDCLQSVFDDIPNEIDVFLSCDGRLQDSHYEVINKFRGLHSNLKTINEDSLCEPLGISSALNSALWICKSDFISRMDADDKWILGRHAIITNWIKSRGDCAVLSGDIFEKNGAQDVLKVGKNLVKWDLKHYFRNPINHVSVTFDREAVISVGGYLNIPGAEDWDLWARLYTSGHKFEYVNSVFAIADTSSLSSRRFGFSFAISEFAVARSLINARQLNLLESIPIIGIFCLRAIVRLVPKRFGMLIYHLLRAPLKG